MTKVTIKTAEEIENMRTGGRILAEVLQTMRTKTQAGLTPKDMAAIAKTKLRSLGGNPILLGYHGYPDVICISVNNQVQHTIPDNRPFQRGDIVNYDFCVEYRGMITDAGITICVGGKPSEDASRLLEGTER